MNSDRLKDLIKSYDDTLTEQRMIAEEAMSHMKGYITSVTNEFLVAYTIKDKETEQIGKRVLSDLEKISDVMSLIVNESGGPARTIRKLIDPNGDPDLPF